MKTLTAAETVKQNSHLLNLDPFIDLNGVLRVGTRLSFTPIEFGNKHQILVSHNSNVAYLLISHFHEISGHIGRAHFLSLSREKYWITKANFLARSVFKHYFACRKNFGTLGKQKMAEPPSEWVAPGLHLFFLVGVDYFGPFIVKRGRCSIKRYGVLFLRVLF